MSPYSNAGRDADAVLLDEAYDTEDLREYFAWYFAAHPLPLPLERYLYYTSVRRFLPDFRARLQGALVPVLLADIDQRFRSLLPAGLGSALDADPELRESLWYGMRLLAEIAYEGDSLSAEQRVAAYATLRELLFDFPALRADYTIDVRFERWVALFRAQLHKLLRDVKELDPLSFVLDTGLTGLRALIVVEHGVLVLDNHQLDQDQLAAIHDLLSGIPSELRNLGHISVIDFLRNSDDEDPHWFRSLGGSSGVNIFGVGLGEHSENPFPSDVEAYSIPVFCGALQHEVNHIVDRLVMSRDEALRRRRGRLIVRAGSEDEMQYLRSMFGPGFFVENWQEFFASIANQYFANSRRTLELGLQRFENGWREPINQFLFFADVYSGGGDTTRFYELDALGNYSATEVAIGRNERDHIDRIAWDGGELHFVIDEAGNVLDTWHSMMPEARVVASDTIGSAPLAVTLDGTASYDPDGGDILSFDWDFGDGTGDSGPQMTHFYESPGRYEATLTVTDDEGEQASATVPVEVIESISIEVSVQSGPDDLREKIGSGRVSDRHTLAFGGDFVNALRFTGVSVPQGAKIRRAYLLVQPAKWGDRPVTVRYRAAASDDARPIKPWPGLLSALPKTSSAVRERLPAFVPGVFNESEDIAAVVQEVVDRPGWAPGNALAVFVETEMRTKRRRLVRSYDDDPGGAPRLVIEFEPPSL